MKWGIRRWQNKDGSLTDAGRIHYGYGPKRQSEKTFGGLEKAMSYHDSKKLAKKYTRAINKQNRDSYRMKGADDAERYKNQREVMKKLAKSIDDTKEQKEMLKAYDALEKHDETAGWHKNKNGEYELRPLTAADNKKRDKLLERFESAQTKALTKEQEIRDSFRSELLGAKLKDLGEEDTAEGRKILNAILRDRDGILSEFTGLKSSREAKSALRELSKVTDQKEKDSWSDFDGDPVRPKRSYDPERSETTLHDYAKQGRNEKAMRSEFDKMRNNATSDEDKDRKVSYWEQARDKGMYDLDFLEGVQNSKALHTHDTNTLLTEYAKYLDHPQEWWQNDRKKLEEE